MHHKDTSDIKCPVEDSIPPPLPTRRLHVSGSSGEALSNTTTTCQYYSRALEAMFCNIQREFAVLLQHHHTSLIHALEQQQKTILDSIQAYSEVAERRVVEEPATKEWNSSGVSTLDGSEDLRAPAVSAKCEELQSLAREVSAVSFILDAEDEHKKQKARKQSQEDAAVVKNVKSRIKNPPKPTRFQILVASNTFETAFGAAILLNSVATGCEVQYMSHHIGSDTPLIFYIVQWIFSLLFLAELVCRIAARGCSGLFCSLEWHWACLDLVIVIVSLAEMALDIILIMHASSHSEDESVKNASNFRIIRMIRITRLVRALRLKRLIRFISALRTLVYSIAVTLKSLLWAMVLLVMIMYVFAITFTQGATEFLLVENVPELTATQLQYYWGDLAYSMLTLLEIISGGLNWNEPCRALAEVGIHMPFFLIVYVSFTYFAVLNVVTGVFCSSAIETAQRNPEIIAHSLIDGEYQYMENLRKLFASIDEDDSGTINITEFEKLVSDEMTRAYFRAMELDTSDAWTLFKLIDADGGGNIDIDEFIKGCESLRGGAKMIDIAHLRSDVRAMAKRQHRFMHYVNEQFELITAQPGTITSSVRTIRMGQPKSRP